MLRLFLLLLAGLIALWKLSSKEAAYYPIESFKVPEEVLKERLATLSAQTTRIPIVMYHYVDFVDPKDTGKFGLATSPYILDKQIAALKETNYVFLFVKDVPKITARKIVLPKKPVVLTFDDGYADFYWQVFPLLKKYQAKATVYVMADYIGGKGYLTLAQLQELRDSHLVEIGSHTLDHAYLKTMNVDAARKQIFDNKQELETLLGIDVTTFAYPYGAFSKETLQIVKAAGHTAAVSVIPGINQSEENIFYLFRIRPGILGWLSPSKALDLYK